MRGPARNWTGTKFRLFPLLPWLRPGRPPETVRISTPAGLVGPGPSDACAYLVNPVGKRSPYGLRTGRSGRRYLSLPPWEGPILRPVQPDRDGHFDHIPVGTPEFAEAHVFGAVRFTMDVWERYLGQPVEWHFSRDRRRLEILMLPSFDNAHVGYGFMEVGAHRAENGATVPFALNFDVIAHETGHLIIYGLMGVPRTGADKGEYFGFQESAADMVAILAALNFETLIGDLLEETRGNLYAFNELNRFAELSATEQIRLASNSATMWEFAAGWNDEHDLSEPLTGALFDILVDVYQEMLVGRGVIGRDLADLSDRLERHPEYDALIQPRFDALYAARPEAFREALVDARDYMGVVLAEAWKRLSADFLDYADVAEALIAADRDLTGGRHQVEMAESFRWRGIGAVEAGPRRDPPDETSHAFSSRTIVPEMLTPRGSVQARRALA